MGTRACWAARLIPALPSSARLDLARPGSARLGLAWLGFANLVPPRPGTRKEHFVWEGCKKVELSPAPPSRGPNSHSRPGSAHTPQLVSQRTPGLGPAWLGSAWLGSALQFGFLRPGTQLFNPTPLDFSWLLHDSTLDLGKLLVPFLPPPTGPQPGTQRFLARSHLLAVCADCCCTGA